MSWSTAHIPDLSGRTAVVTGANGGLGLATARALAGAGAHVVMAARDLEKAAAAETNIRDGRSDASLQVVSLDLASLDSVRDAAAKIVSDHDRIDILVNNAGVMGIPERRTPEGFEMQCGVNHFGHWALTGLLLPALLEAPDPRVVTVTSVGHHLGRPLDPSDPHMRRGYGPWRAYNSSKLANFYFGLGLQREFERAGARAKSLIAHPGLSNTDLQAKSVRETQGGFYSRVFHVLAGSVGMPAERGALSQLRAATDPSARGGEFYGPRFMTSGPPVRVPVLRRIGFDRIVTDLWRISEDATGVTIDVGPAR